MTDPLGTEAPMVHVIDDDEAVRDSLATLLDISNIPVRTFAGGHAFLEDCPPDQAGCVVADLRMPGMDGTALQEEMARRGYAMPLILISAHGDVGTAVTALRKGAVDFLEKPFDDGVFLQRVTEALHHDANNREARRATDDARHRLNLLSGREQEVAALMVDGCPNKVIATRLGIGVRTVETHRAHLLDKLQIKTVADLMRLWLAAER